MLPPGKGEYVFPVVGAPETIAVASPRTIVEKKDAWGNRIGRRFRRRPQQPPDALGLAWVPRRFFKVLRVLGGLGWADFWPFYVAGEEKGLLGGARGGGWRCPEATTTRPEQSRTPPPIALSPFPSPPPPRSPSPTFSAAAPCSDSEAASSLVSSLPPLQPPLTAPLSSASSLRQRLPFPRASDFAVDDYLVSTCGLTRAQALKARPTLSHFKSPSKPDAVLAFLAGLGLSAADVAALVAKDPQLLCAKVEKTLAPTVAGLTGLGLSRCEIARLVSLPGVTFRCRSIVSGLQYCLPLFGSSENLLRVLRSGSILSSDLDRVVKPNVAFLHECGLGACDIAKLYVFRPSPLSISTERIRTAVACVDSLGVPRGSPMFRHALQAVAFLSEDKITAKVEHLKKTFRWSNAEVGIAVSKGPAVLSRTKESLQRRSEFLISELGLEPGYIAYRPALLTYGLEGRLRPRYYAVKFLKENGLLDRDRDYYAAVVRTEKVFMKNYICPHIEAAPHLAEDYAAACRGEVPTRFRFA